MRRLIHDLPQPMPHPTKLGTISHNRRSPSWARSFASLQSYLAGSKDTSRGCLRKDTTSIAHANHLPPRFVFEARSNQSRTTVSECPPARHRSDCIVFLPFFSSLCVHHLPLDYWYKTTAMQILPTLAVTHSFSFSSPLFLSY